MLVALSTASDRQAKPSRDSAIGSDYVRYTEDEFQGFVMIPQGYVELGVFDVVDDQGDLTYVQDGVDEFEFVDCKESTKWDRVESSMR